MPWRRAALLLLATGLWPLGAWAQTFSFQDGLQPPAAYAGTQDAALSESQPDTPFGAGAELFADGDDPSGSGRDMLSLLRWDVSAIPPGTVVQSVELTIQVTNRSQGSYGLYQVLAPWVEVEVTWNEAAAGIPWQGPGAQGAQDRGATLLGSVAAGSLGSYTAALNAFGVAVVQGWVDDPASNHGLVLADPSVTNGLDFASREVPVAPDRPRLTVNPTTQAPDSDADGMPDAWETFYSFDPVDPSDASGDGDRDGVSNLDEFLQGTHPRSVSVSPTV